MNITQLSLLISKKFNLSKAESHRILSYILDEISNDLAAGERVSFRGFGSLTKILRPPRKYRNIKTGEIESKPSHPDVEFQASTTLLNLLINKPKRNIL
jgi:DNA-binding protein HU-beta